MNSTTPERAVTDPAGAVTTRRLVLALVTMGQFLVVLDYSIIQIALPTIRGQLGVSVADSTWLVSAYGLTFAGFLMLSGRASDLYGGRRLFILGLTVFVVSSLTGGLAPSFLILVVARATQGIGAAIASATALSLIVALFPEGQERNRALSFYATVSSGAFAAGVILGGLLTSTLGWRSVLFVNVPIGTIAAVLSRKYLARDHVRPAGSKRLDVPGALSVTIGLMLLAYALTNAANGYLASTQTFLALALAAIVLSAFFMIEYRSKDPLVPLGFLRRRTMFGANAIGLLNSSGMTVMVFIVTIYLQQLLGYGALYAGLAFVPMALLFFVTGVMAARLIARFGVRYVLILAMSAEVVGFLLLSRISVSGGYLTNILPGMVVAAFGGGTVYPSFRIAAVSGTRKGEAGLASGLVNTAQQIGGPLGLAVLLTIAEVVTKGLGGANPSTGALLVGFQYAFLVAALLAGVGILMASLIGRPVTGAGSVGRVRDRSGLPTSDSKTEASQ